MEKSRGIGFSGVFHVFSVQKPQSQHTPLPFEPHPLPPFPSQPFTSFCPFLLFFPFSFVFCVAVFLNSDFLTVTFYGCYSRNLRLFLLRGLNTPFLCLFLRVCSGKGGLASGPHASPGSGTERQRDSEHVTFLFVH